MCKQQKMRLRKDYGRFRCLLNLWCSAGFLSLLIHGLLIEAPLVSTMTHLVIHRGWAALKEAWLLCQASCKKERGWIAERKTGKEKVLRVQKASERKDSSFTWPPWSFRCCYLEHKHWHGILRIWKFPHIRQHQPISCRPRCSFHPWAPCGGVKKPKHQKGRGGAAE